jgi:hypothetical protein
MNTDVICINNTFSSDVLYYYSKYGIKIPEKDKIYSIRTKQKHINGDWGVTLNEINNPKVPGDNILTANSMVDVTFNLKRFTDLLGNPLLAEKDEMFEPELEEVKLNNFYELNRKK